MNLTCTAMSDHKKILLVIGSLNGGGAEKNCLRLLRGFQARGHDAHLISLYSHADYEIGADTNVHVLQEKKARFGTKRTNARLLRQKVTQLGDDFDLVLANLADAVYAVADAQLDNAHYVLRNSILGQMAVDQKRIGKSSKKYTQLLKAYEGKRLIGVSQGLQHEIEGLLQSYELTTTIYNPYNFDYIRSKADEIVDDLPSQPYIIHVGRTARQKRHDVLLKAFAASGLPHQLLLLTHKPKKLQPLIEELGLEDRVLFKTFTQNPYAYMRGADLTVLSSDFEGFCNVVVESLIVGTPVVSTDCPHGSNEILTGDLAHCLTPVGDAEALAAKMQQCIDMKANFTAPNLSHLHIDHIIDQYIALC